MYDALQDGYRNLPKRKRSRSASLSSDSSVATISTNASDPKTAAVEHGTAERRRSDTSSRSPSTRRSKSPPRTSLYRNECQIKDRDIHNLRLRPRRRREEDDGDISNPGCGLQLSAPHHKRRNRGRQHYEDFRNDEFALGRKRSRSPNILPDTGRQRNTGSRQRSLSPYSRRLALTQAMNAGSQKT